MSFCREIKDTTGHTTPVSLFTTSPFTLFAFHQLITLFFDPLTLTSSLLSLLHHFTPTTLYCLPGNVHICIANDNNFHCDTPCFIARVLKFDDIWQLKRNFSWFYFIFTHDFYSEYRKSKQHGGFCFRTFWTKLTTIANIRIANLQNIVRYYISMTWRGGLHFFARLIPLLMKGQSSYLWTTTKSEMDWRRNLNCRPDSPKIFTTTNDSCQTVSYPFLLV